MVKYGDTRFQPDSYDVRMFFWQIRKRQRGRKKFPEVWRKDLTSLERHRKLFAACSSLKDRGSSQVDEDCSAGRCWRKCGGIGWGEGKWGELKDREFKHLGFGSQMEPPSCCLEVRAARSRPAIPPAHDRSGNTHNRQEELREVRLICVCSCVSTDRSTTRISARQHVSVCHGLSSPLGPLRLVLFPDWSGQSESTSCCAPQSHRLLVPPYVSLSLSTYSICLWFEGRSITV